ncbi:leucine Rich Repeat [Seminavis robusta]|uniref:Leucine Rich Repeat n=1 Tax=Seminavis robusta TaxID=568900 RepID=A0A9N8ENG8_9STRA|nr:leucine Rich Repeat [Seminavis robusta]|eukprot:Sro1530_g280080.1 leucine Rich Repeat (277) ;mRNA; r:8695-9718
MAQRAAKSHHHPGIVPTEIGNLASTMTTLYIGHTHLALPKEVYKLTSLETLYIGLEQEPVGPLELHRIFKCMRNLTPSSYPMEAELCLLSDLERLGIADTNITGSLPSELWKLTNLVNLDVGSNALTGTVPTDLALLSSLETLYLDSNNLTGTLPSNVYEHLGGLTRLYISDNPISGTIPTEVGLLGNLTYLHVHRTSLSGTLPASLLSLLQLDSRLSLVDTNLSGSIPDGLCNATVRDELNCPRLDFMCQPRFVTWNASVCEGTALCGCGCDECS